MKKTCFNCKYFHGCLAEADPSQYHIHNYCEIFKTILPFDMDSEVNKFLENHWNTMWKASIDCEYGVNDDLETGEASCYLFEEADKPFWLDERFEKNKSQNRKLAIKTLEYMFEKDEVWDEFDEYTWHKLDDYFDEDELAYLKDLLVRLKKEEEKDGDDDSK